MVAKVFSFAIPLTIIAFYIGDFILPEGDSFYGPITTFDYISVPVCFVGVFLYNWYPEKQVKVSIQNIQ